MPIIRIKTNNRSRVIGFLNPKNKTFTKTIYASRHIFRAFDAIGLDAAYFTDVLLPNDYDIIVYEKEEGMEYRIKASKFKKHAQYFHFIQKTEDNQAQIFCSRVHWDKVKWVDITGDQMLIESLK